MQMHIWIGNPVYGGVLRELLIACSWGIYELPDSLFNLARVPCHDQGTYEKPSQGQEAVELELAEVPNPAVEVVFVQRPKVTR